MAVLLPVHVTAVTMLEVYDWIAPDGLRGGSAHVHLASTEGYVVPAGHGRLQTLGTRGYTESELHPGDCLWFTPGIIHRLVNEGGLRLLVVMSNAGLPEAGDAVLTFPPEILADPAALEGFFAAAVRLVAGRVPQWRQRWQAGAFAAAAATGRQLDQRADGDAAYLAAGVLRQIARPAGPAGYRMCGLLTRYDPATSATSR